MGKIIGVTPGDSYTITIEFDNQHSVTMDLNQKIYTVRFSELRDKDVFRQVKSDGNSVYWPGGISMAVSEIMEIVGK